MKTKNVFYLKIAGFIIKIKFKKRRKIWEGGDLREEIQKYFQGFLVSDHKKPDFIIYIEESRHYGILRKKSIDFILFQKRLNNKEILSFSYISKSQFETILSMALNKLLGKRGFIFHASAVAHKDEAFIFAGKPGAGKSTIMKLLSKDFLPIADDGIIIKQENGKYVAYQTPFTEKEAWIRKGVNRYKIKGIFFLKKANKTMIKKINDNQLIIKKIFGQIFTERDFLVGQTKLIFDFILKSPRIFYLYFPKNKAIVDFFFRFINRT